MDICALIEEAKCCAAGMAHEKAHLSIFGNDDDELTFNWLRLNCYIRILERNIPRTYIKKEVVADDVQIVSLSSLKRRNNLLVLENVKEHVVCSKVEISPCLSESEICSIAEEIKILCSNCNCNCN